MTFVCQAILFDLDGVLVDSTAIAERHWRTWAERHGLPSEEIARSHHGRPAVETIREVAPHLDAEREARRKEAPEAHDTDGLEVFAGAADLLAALPADRWAIVTSGLRETAMHRIRHTGLPDPRVLVTADDVDRGKPAPDPYLLAAERLGVDPASCLVVEDAPAGIDAARAAGARVLAVATSHDASALFGADAVVRRLEQIRVEVGTDSLVVEARGA